MTTAVSESRPVPVLSSLAVAPDEELRPAARRVTVLRPVPHDPPYDDELVDAAAGSAVAAVHTAGALALAVAPALAPAFPPAFAPTPAPARPAPDRPPLRLVPPLPAEVPTPGEDPDFAPQPTPTAALPSARRWAAALVQALLEVRAGTRPAGQLRRWTTGEVYADLERYSTVTAAARAAATRPADRAPSATVSVRSVHVTEPADGVAEVTAVVRRGPRCGAVALRLEGVDGRWLCSALEIA